MMKISLVSYINTYPFLYGIENYLNGHQVELSKDVPALCTERFKNKEADIALVPVATLPELEDYKIISDCCIGGKGDVDTVLLCANVPLQHIKNVYLDTDSRTSVQLLKVLADFYWNRKWSYMPLDSVSENMLTDLEAVLLIGDKTFSLRHAYPYVYDLSGSWFAFKQRPFVFAVWVARNHVPDSFVQDFNKALKEGLKHKKEAVEAYRPLGNKADLLSYVERKIDYVLDKEKRETIDLFHQYVRMLEY